MTIAELIEILQECQTELGDNAEVRLMTQYNWPFENSLLGVALSTELREEDDDEESDEEPVLYLVEGSQLGYGTKRAWEVARR